MSSYRVAVNIEWTGACNARCVMCPREVVTHPRHMSESIYEQVLERLDPGDVFRAVIAGYGEPTVHPRFERFVAMTRDAAVPIDMVTNGERLTEARLRALDGAIGALVISFSSVDPAVYRRIHVGLDQRRVMENLTLARRVFKKSALAVSLTPLPDCIETLPRTIDWLRGQGIDLLTMSPTLYDRAGTLPDSICTERNLRSVIRRYRLHSQEYDFVPSVRDLWHQWRANRFRCLPRNSDLAIAADGSYQYCFNDIGHRRPLGSVETHSVREALSLREPTPPDPELCDNCTTRSRYTPWELLQAAAGYARLRLSH
ncbi:MAG: hypothetical protein Kow006_07050 [Gammaproteobacteria bacterium]